MFEIYVKHRNYKRAYGQGFITDNYNRLINAVEKTMNTWWWKNGIYEWIKIKDKETGKYVKTFENSNYVKTED
jgi:hypothetical protein